MLFSLKLFDIIRHYKNESKHKVKFHLPLYAADLFCYLPWIIPHHRAMSKPSGCDPTLELEREIESYAKLRDQRTMFI